MSEPGRVVTFGELLLRLSPAQGAGWLETPRYSANLGGCEANVAVSLAHLDVPVRYVSALPDNPLGRAALASVQAEGVEVTAELVAGSRLGLFFVDLGDETRPPVTVYDRADSAFAGVSADRFDWTRVLSGASWLHCSGITPALGPGPLAALEAALTVARASRCRVSFDLNYRPALWTGRDPKPVITPLIQGVDLLIGNAASLSAMLGLERPEPRAVATATGARSVAVTRRVVQAGGVHEWSATFYDGQAGREASSEVYRIRAVDRTGGGDSFAAALLWGVREGNPPDLALRRAVVAGAHKLCVPGDWNRMGREQLVRLAASPDPSWS